MHELINKYTSKYTSIENPLKCTAKINLIKKIYIW